MRGPTPFRLTRRGEEGIERGRGRISQTASISEFGYWLRATCSNLTGPNSLAALTLRPMPMDNDLAMRRRRALYRATHRGSKELDFLLGRCRRADRRGPCPSPKCCLMERLIEISRPGNPHQPVRREFRCGDSDLDDADAAPALLPRGRAGPHEKLLTTVAWPRRRHLKACPSRGCLAVARRSPAACRRGSTPRCSARSRVVVASSKPGKPILHIARDGQRLATLDDALAFFAPDVKRLSFPAWDGVPYDRVAPNAEIIARRVATLAELAQHRGGSDETPLIVLTTVNAVLQRVPPHEFFAGAMQNLARPATRSSMAELIERLEHVGYGRAGTVTDPGAICRAWRHPRSLSAWRASPSASISSATRWNRSALSIPRRSAR